ncbi:Uncharacterized protein APZ42_030554 [Daphnia magna]|uniref:Uncharacterized protein n=2 Tax=Daphnia magna TaxID=35525 RepID=A0A0N8DES9_9CRUS|nr:hypothetical protein OUZ56_001350 [Daphnia magna]KZS06090.1 Uncharacterized protein APZ42_030554 [Daphnia magna]
MDFFVLLLATCCMIFQGNAQYRPYSYNNFYQYPNYPMAAMPIHNLVPQNRFFWTWTSTTTSTSISTCTVFTSVNCPGRRKRFLIENLDTIEPSSLNKVETTHISDRKAAREIDFETAFLTDPVTYEVQSTFGNPNFFSGYNPFFREPVNKPAIGPRFFLKVTTSTVTTVSIYTSRPACYSGGGYDQC